MNRLTSLKRKPSVIRTFFFNLSQEQFSKLLELALKESVLLFNGDLFRQVDGVAMGSPLVPCVANAFMCHHETIRLNECPIELKPVVYKRYVDDFSFFNF